MMVGRSVQRFVLVSPKKVKPVLEVIRGKNVSEATWILELNNKRKLSRIILKGLKAAVASYRNKSGTSARPDEELVIVTAKVDRGPILKRWRAAWRGRAVMIRKRMSHITIEVGEGS